VGAFEGAMYEGRGYYRPQADCIMFTRDEVGFCAVVPAGHRAHHRSLLAPFTSINTISIGFVLRFLVECVAPYRVGSDDGYLCAFSLPTPSVRH
jgi:hypothetical protein